MHMAKIAWMLFAGSTAIACTSNVAQPESRDANGVTTKGVDTTIVTIFEDGSTKTYHYVASQAQYAREVEAKKRHIPLDGPLGTPTAGGGLRVASPEYWLFVGMRGVRAAPVTLLASRDGLRVPPARTAPGAGRFENHAAS